MDKLSKILLGSYAFILLVIGFYFLFKPDLSSNIYPFSINDIETFENANLERKIMSEYGGGCSQKIGVSI